MDYFLNGKRCSKGVGFIRFKKGLNKKLANDFL